MTRTLNGLGTVWTFRTQTPAGSASFGMLVPVTRRQTRTVVALAAVLIGQGVLYSILLKYPEFSFQRKFGPASTRWYSLGLLIGTVPLWLAAVWLLHHLHLSRRVTAVLVLGAGAALSCTAMLHPPATSDDDYRYMWDAKVQLSGTDPYRYAPTDPRLEHLHEGPNDTTFFGAPGQYVHVIFGGTTPINRPFDRTIYPPVAQGTFDVIRLASFGADGKHTRHLPWQIAATLGLLATGAFLLRRSPSHPWRAAMWTWCPALMIDFVNNAHIDWAGVFLVVLALGTTRGRVLTGALVGAAVAIKIYPALVLPSLVRRSWWIAVSAIVFVALTYVPHVIAVGTDVIGYLPSYLKEEQYTSGQRFALLSEVLPHPLETIAGVAIVAAIAIWAWRRGSLTDPARSAADVVGVTFLVVTPPNGWYAGILLALVAMTGMIEWIPVMLAAEVSYDFYPPHTTATFAVALLLVIALRWRDHWAPRWLRGGSDAPTTELASAT